MTLHQKWRMRRKLREAKDAISKYNDAVTQLAEAAEIIRALAAERGVLTPEIEKGVEEIRNLSQTAAISERDLQGGGRNGTE